MTLTIVPQPVKIVWDGAGEYEYDGQMHSLTATVTGISNGNTVSLTVTYNNPTSYITNVGSLTRTVSINNSNYTLVGADGDISATVTIVEAE